MATKKPSKLSDIFNMTNAVIRPRTEGSSSRLGKALDIDGITTRYQRNKVLIDPRSFHLMTDYDTLKRYKVFAAYKPPFAPMRRTESYENHHRVSMESYISAAMKSRDMEPIISVLLKGENPNAPYRAPSSFDTSSSVSSLTTSSSMAQSEDTQTNTTGHEPEALQIRVINDLPEVAAGPVLVHLADPSLYVHNDFTRYNFEAIVYGHIKLREATEIESAVEELRLQPAKLSSTSSGSSSSSVGVHAAAIDGTIRGGYAGTMAAIGNTVDLTNLSVLYPNITTPPPAQRSTTVPRKSLTSAMLKASETLMDQKDETLVTIPSPPRIDAPGIRVAVRNYGFYATHPATLIRFTAQSPGTAAKPDLLTFVRAATGSYVIGDPASKKDTANLYLKTLRAGDKDFPRVFVNLRSLGVSVYQQNPLWGDRELLSSNASSPQRENDLALAQSPWLFHPKYLEFTCDGSLDNLLSDSQLSMKRARICLTDGFWTPTMKAGF